MSTIEKKYHKKEIAAAQLKTAVEMFLKNKYLSSAISLSSAAGNILNQLAQNAGKEAFVDYACRIYAHINKTQTPSRQKFKHHIDKTLGIPPHKHMSGSDPETVELDLFQCAEDGLTRTISDYVALYGQEESFIKNFLLWKWHSRDGKKLMEELKGVSKKLLQKKDKRDKKNT